MKADIKDEDEDFDLEKNKIVKKYFSRIFTTLKPDIRYRLNKLEMNEEKKKKLKRELAFLPHDKQIEYLDEILNNFSSSEK